jgi:uncharacterized protein (DUF934 family)
MPPPEVSPPAGRHAAAPSEDPTDVPEASAAHGQRSASARAPDGAPGGGDAALRTDQPHRAGAAAVPARPEGARDRADSIWLDGAFRRDAWATATSGEALPDRPVIVSKQRWLAERAALAGRNAPLGLRLEAGEPLDDLAGDLARFCLIALAFPTFSDGRAFSTARLLRDKHAYAGELRAVGNVLSDLIPFMRRVGFDSFEVRHGPTRRALSEGRIAEVTLHYQPSTRDGPRWARRPANRGARRAGSGS